MVKEIFSLHKKPTTMALFFPFYSTSEVSWMDLNSRYFLSTLVPPNSSLKRFGSSFIPSRRRWWWNPAVPAQNTSQASQTCCHTLKTHLFLLRGKACSSAAASSGSFMINLLYPCYNPAGDVCDALQGVAKPDCSFKKVAFGCKLHVTKCKQALLSPIFLIYVIELNSE